jgi:hypothetical protein
MKKSWRLVALFSLLAGGGAFGGCQRSLFMGSDAYTQQTIDRYWDGDSARETTEARQRSSDMGFGFPTGMANQQQY